MLQFKHKITIEDGSIVSMCVCILRRKVAYTSYLIFQIKIASYCGLACVNLPNSLEIVILKCLYFLHLLSVRSRVTWHMFCCILWDIQLNQWSVATPRLRNLYWLSVLLDTVADISLRAVNPNYLFYDPLQHLFNANF